MDLSIIISVFSGIISIITSLIASATLLYISKKERNEKDITKKCKEICINLELFYELEEEYSKVVTELRTEKGMPTYNKPESVKKEMRSKIIDKRTDDVYFTYKPSKMKEYKDVLNIE